ncbi:MAG TPA: xanthine dehydrogenase family protein molybdopterin-binding subunit [Candidatus Angelobacter sp.]|jgi:isoquinoline 1-oxidoreductase beta subunit|nr:xanthine dehydrogenase family protein molybdopterin-binding subunit [Candidatus Angelobacter sp.]
MTAAGLDRREFLRASAAVGGGLLISLYVPELELARAQSPATGGKVFAPNAFVRIGTDEIVTVIANHSEMGQGVYTSLPMLLNEELEADWSKVRVEPAPVDAAYNHTAFGIQMTGGSTTTTSEWERYRKMGAAARVMLVQAAAQQWNVPAGSCHVEKGVVIHAASGKKASYGSLANAAAAIPVPSNVPLKDPKNFITIGKKVRRLDTPSKTNGTAQFGLDVTLPGMLTALVARAPVFGGKVVSFDASESLKVPGVRTVEQVPSGVAVIASGFWPARLGRERLKINWDDGANAEISSTKMLADFSSQSASPGLVAKKAGDPVGALAGAAKKITAEYDVPYLAHAMMEPLNCVVDLRADSCEIWTGTQFQTGDRANAAKVAGLAPEKVQIHTTLLGGGFGRRANPASDFVMEAVNVAKAAKAPVKVMWTREDDIRGGWYRPMWHDRFAAGLDANGEPIAWTHTIVGQSIMEGTPFEAFGIQNGIDSASVEGAADLLYGIPNLQVDLHSPKIGVPVQWWRSVGHSHTGFSVEAFFDEVAHAGGKDPYQLRRKLLAKQPRMLGVLDLVAQKAGWGKPMPAGRGRGIATHFSFDSYVAQVIEASVEKDGTVHVHRVVCAVDCGRVINPDTVTAQMEGGIIFALTAALKTEITLENGRVQQRNFHDYPMLRMFEAPAVEVFIVPSEEKPTGVGEPSVPPVAPALTNAIFAATGKRVRRLPIRSSDLAAGAEVKS